MGGGGGRCDATPEAALECGVAHRTSLQQLQLGWRWQGRRQLGPIGQAQTGTAAQLCNNGAGQNHRFGNEQPGGRGLRDLEFRAARAVANASLWLIEQQGAMGHTPGPPLLQDLIKLCQPGFLRGSELDQFIGIAVAEPIRRPDPAALNPRRHDVAIACQFDPDAPGGAAPPCSQAEGSA